MQALKRQEETSESKEFNEFLEPIKMERYWEVFVENGIDDVETLVECKDEHLEKMNIPLGHRLKIMKRIKEFKQAKPSTAPVFVTVKTQESEVQSAPI